MREAVVFIHGIWMTGAEMLFLRRRLSQCGFDCFSYRYQSLRRSPRENATHLNQYLQEIRAEVIHLVAHSLGGIVLLHLFDQYPEQKPGRVVMLGTPIRGSQVAEKMAASKWTQHLLGRSVERGLLGDAPRWQVDRELGIIAGTEGIGIGKVFMMGKLQEPNDGTVRLAATYTSGLADHRALPFSHHGMLFARPVATAVCRFLQTGKFD
jgi:pimeloyl-ACP methyl ester carboxylesterase